MKTRTNFLMSLVFSPSRSILYFLLLVIPGLNSISANAQNIFSFVVSDSASKQPMQGVSVQFAGSAEGQQITNDKGLVSFHSNDSVANVSFSYVGYRNKTMRVNAGNPMPYPVLLSAIREALQDVTVVASTRSNDPVESATTKVEVLGLEEMNEESTIKPGNIGSILGDMSGIQIQQSSAVNGNANVRIQGLAGKYTQVLRDGMPLYEGFSGGFGILSIPPLDLKQIELIKGAASTLYGGGAIAGLINLISKKPAYRPDAAFLLNQSTLKETNVNAWYAQRGKHLGFTMFAGENLQQEVDVNKDGFSDVPDTKATIIHPTFFIYPSEKSFVSLSWSGSFENRIGGDMQAIKGRPDGAHVYFEKNKLNRNSYTIMSENRFSNDFSATLKAAYSVFSRDETTNTIFFSGKQQSYYAEAAVNKRTSRHNIVGGTNLTGDGFKPSTATPVPVGSFSNTTVGAFAQDTWLLTDKTKMELGLRGDHHFKYGNFVLPRFALFHHFYEAWGTRLGFGMGYKTPNALTPQIKDYSIFDIQAMPANIKPEKSVGANAEINYKKEWGDGNKFFINHAFFLTSISSPIVGTEQSNGDLSFMNYDKPIVTAGFDTYIQMEWDGWEFYLGYTYTNAERKYLDSRQFMPLTPKNRSAFVLAYEIEGKWRFGLEGSSTGYQRREDYSKTPAFYFMAAMIEKKFGPKWSLVLNGENLLDARQSRHESLYTCSISTPTLNRFGLLLMDGLLICLYVFDLLNKNTNQDS